MSERAIGGVWRHAGLVAIVFAALAGCYSPKFDNCAVLCGADNSCPSGSSCGSDGYCHGSGGAPTCSGIDASSPDGTPGDAAISSAGFVMLSAGQEHTCGIDDTGTADGSGRLWCWGRNELGALGADPNDVPRAGAPRQVGTDDDWVRVSAGSFHTCGIRGTALYCWGYNGSQQLGDPLMSGANVIASPNPVQAATGFREVSAGGDATCAIDINNKLWCWGSNNAGVLARGTNGGVSSTPTQITTGAAPTNSFKRISMGREHACAIHTNYELYCWGDGSSGRLGNSATNGVEAVPVRVVSGETAWDEIQTATRNSCGTTMTGKLYCWGDNSAGQIGLPTFGTYTEPEQVGTDTGWAALASAHHTTCATRTGMLYCTGDNSEGQLGSGDWRSVSSQFIPVAGVTAPRAVTVGDFHGCVIDGQDRAWCWGSNGDGQLGEGMPADERVPTRIGTGDWKHVSAGARHTCAIDVNDDLYCWGLNANQQLGNSDVSTGESRATPVRVGTTSGWDAVSAGANHTCALLDGQLWCWGANNTNQCGLPLTTPRPPTRIEFRTDWTAVSGGDSSMCGVVSTGSERHCWGRSSSNQLGNDSQATVTSPGLVSDGITWNEVSIGENFGCGVATNQQLYCWGDRTLGSVGDGMFSATQQATPTSIGNNYSGISVSVARGHACALTGGTLRCWGANDFGQLGQDDSTHRNQPTQVGIATSWTAVSTGGEHTCGLQGTQLFCWGENGNGRLGDGTIVNRGTPGARIGALGWKSISAGHYYSCGITTNDELYCWGEGTFGQLGLGRSARTSPVRVTLPN